ncbi:DUF308 domain-containing protein [Chloroflexi bacterium TSY]|nr:DUF308 domain-containing protein [Chloroflexi bacterium TSY]
MTAVATQQSQPNVQTVPRWVVLIQGILSLMIGIYLFTNPASTVIAIVIAWGLFMFVGGIVNTFGGIFHEKGAEGWGWRIFAGIIQILVGGFVLAHPLLTSLIAPSAMAWVLGVGAVVSMITPPILSSVVMVMAAAFVNIGIGVGLIVGSLMMQKE